MKWATVAVLLGGLLAWPTARAGWIEDRGDTTIIHVKVFELPHPAQTDPANRGDLAAVRAFEKQFPKIFAQRYRVKYRANPQKYGHHNWDHVEIALEPFSGLSVLGVESDLLAIAGGLAPDVMYVIFRKSDNYIQNNFLYPLDKPEDGYFTSLTPEDIKFRINSKLWPVIRRRGPDGQQHIWALPYGGALGKVLMYRKELFDKHHIPYPTVDWTWNDMLAACRKISDPEHGIYGLMSGRGKDESWWWATYLWSAGGEVMKYNDKTDQWRCMFDSEAAAVALDFYVQLDTEKWVDSEGKVQRGYTAKEGTGNGAKWVRGEVGMMIGYIDERIFATINPELTGMVPVPLGPTGMRGAELNGTMMGLFSEIKDPAVRDAAWEYMRFFDCEDAVRIKTGIMVQGGLGQFVNPHYLQMFGYPEIERLAPKGWAKTFDVAIATGQPEPYGRNSNVAYQMMTYPIEQAEQMALHGELPANRQQRLKVLRELLRKANERANEVMIGIIPPAEREKRRIAAALVLIGLAVTFTLVFLRVVRAFTPPQEPGMGKRKGWDFRRYAWAYVLLLPAVGTILIWQYVPLGQGSVMAFFDYRLLGKSVWVGLDNFGDLLFDSFWWQSVWNSLRYSFLVIALTFLPPIILAILLQEVPRLKLLFRIVFYLPAVITGIVTVLLWRQFYDPSESGVLNQLILRIPAIGFVGAGLVLLWVALMFARRVWMHQMYLVAWGFVIAGLLMFSAVAGLAQPILFPAGEALRASLAALPHRLFRFTPEPYWWLIDPRTAMLSCVIPMVWTGMGPGCLIYLAALKGIPDDYYEAADIDGASFIDKIMFVVFPTLKALVVINFVGVFIGAWYGAAGNILAMTGGGANTEVADLHIWYAAFTYLKFGPATAMAWTLGFMLIGFTIYQLRILSRVEFRTTEEKK